MDPPRAVGRPGVDPSVKPLRGVQYDLINQSINQSPKHESSLAKLAPHLLTIIRTLIQKKKSKEAIYPNSSTLPRSMSCGQELNC